MRNGAAVRLVMCATAMMAGASQSVESQASVHGAVFDSLRNAPLVGALVSVPGTAIRSRTDARGRYELRDLTPGAYRVMVQAPFLDSMALGPIETDVQVRLASLELNLGTIGLAQYQRAVCGAALEDEQGIVVGFATRGGEPATDVLVAALWNETVLTTTGTSGLLRGAGDTTNAAGFFALCGVPVGATYQMRAGDDTLGSAVLDIVSSDQRVRRRDVRVGAPTTDVRLRGRVVGPDGVALEASVEEVGDSTSIARTTAGGEFERQLANRSGQLWLRAVGFIPKLLDVEPDGSEIDLGDVAMERVPQELEGRLIEGRLLTQREFEFEERKKAGIGQFVDSTTLARYPRVTVSVLASLASSVRVQRRGRNEFLMLSRAGDVCAPIVFVDGNSVGRSTGVPELPQILNEAKRIEFYRAALAPSGFQDFEGCGVVLIWTY
jgi:hypothetical protein